MCEGHKMPCLKLPYRLEIPSHISLAIMLNVFEAATHQLSTASQYPGSANKQ